jgi:hypothetical protein
MLPELQITLHGEGSQIMIGWNIVRTKPIAKTYGRAIPVFIHNFQYHFATVDVYSDGAIDCWGFVDRSLFATKVRSGWVATMPPIGDTITIFNLGQAHVAAADWSMTPTRFHGLVEATLQELNPLMTGRIDMHGSDVELRGKVRYAKLGMADERPFRRLSDGSEILGKSLPVFARHSDMWLLRQWFVYADGLSQFGCEGELMPLDEAARRILEGEVTTRVPDGSWITMDHLGSFQSKDGWWGISLAERIREAYDELDMLQGHAGSIRICVDAHQSYEKDPSEENREHLRAAYEAVPKHLRIFCGDQDSKDGPIRRILYPTAADD